MRLIVIALSGYKGVGKTTFALNLREFLLWQNKEGLPLVAKSIGLADALKEKVADTFGFSLEEIESLKREEDKKVLNDMSMRELLIDFGQKQKEEFGKYIWCETALKRVLSDVSKGGVCIWIVPDVRFPEEQEFFRGLNTVMLCNIWLEREGFSLEDINLDDAEKQYKNMSFDRTITLKDGVSMFVPMMELTFDIKRSLKWLKNE